MKSWTVRMTDEQDIRMLKDYESIKSLALLMGKTALDSEEIVSLSWTRDDAMMLAGVLHRIQMEIKGRLGL